MRAMKGALPSQFYRDTLSLCAGGFAGTAALALSTLAKGSLIGNSHLRQDTTIAKVASLSRASLRVLIEE